MTQGLVLRLKLGKEIGEILELVEYEVASLPLQSGNLLKSE